MAATKQQHAQRCCENYLFQGKVAQKEIDVRSNEWRVTALFYSALQAIDAYLASQGVQTTSHTDRGEKLTQQITIAKQALSRKQSAGQSTDKEQSLVESLETVADEYEVLKTLSHTARYKPNRSISDGDLTQASSSLESVCGTLHPIVNLPLAMCK